MFRLCYRIAKDRSISRLNKGKTFQDLFYVHMPAILPIILTTKLMTPGGKPASRNILYTVYDDSMAVSDGFHSTAFPINAGAVLRLPPMAVTNRKKKFKLN
jgi:hypothetical protein